MGPIFIPPDLNIEDREIHWKPLPQKETVLCHQKSFSLAALADHDLRYTEMGVRRFLI
jgi:hypothetical protein